MDGKLNILDMVCLRNRERYQDKSVQEANSYIEVRVSENEPTEERGIGEFKGSGEQSSEAHRQ